MVAETAHMTKTSVCGISNRARRIPGQSTHQCMRTCCRSSQRCQNMSLNCYRHDRVKNLTYEDCCWCQRREGAVCRGSTLVEACMGCEIRFKDILPSDHCSSASLSILFESDKETNKHQKPDSAAKSSTKSVGRQ